MVEVPGLALQAAEIAPEVDFFSIGTNDLAQYTMAAERGNAALAGLLDDSLSPVLALVATVTAARDGPRPLGRRLRRARRRPRGGGAARRARRARAEHGREPDPGRQGGAARSRSGGGGSGCAARSPGGLARPVPDAVARGSIGAPSGDPERDPGWIALRPPTRRRHRDADPAHPGRDGADPGRRRRRRDTLAAVLFCVAGATDYVDGALARRWQVTSKLGSFLDTTADKLLVSGVLIALLAADRVSPWIVALIVGRELVLMGLRGIIASEGEVMAPSMLGKLKTSVQFVAIPLAILRLGDPLGGLLRRRVGDARRRRDHGLVGSRLSRARAAGAQARRLGDVTRVFLTGGSGLIGGALAGRLAQRGDELVALARSDAAARAARAARGAGRARRRARRGRAGGGHGGLRAALPRRRHQHAVSRRSGRAPARQRARRRDGRARRRARGRAARRADLVGGLARRGARHRRPRGHAAPRELPLGLRALQARGRARGAGGRAARGGGARLGQPVVGPGTGSRGRHRPDHDRLPQRPAARVRRHADQHRRHRGLRRGARAGRRARRGRRALRDQRRHDQLARGAGDRLRALRRASRREAAAGAVRARGRGARRGRVPGARQDAAGVPRDGPHAAPRSPLRRLARRARARPGVHARRRDVPAHDRLGGRAGARAAPGPESSGARAGNPLQTSDRRRRFRHGATRRHTAVRGPRARRRPSRPRRASRPASTRSPRPRRSSASPTSPAASRRRSSRAPSTTGVSARARRSCPRRPEKTVERRFSEGIEESPTSE